MGSLLMDAAILESLSSLGGLDSLLLAAESTFFSSLGGRLWNIGQVALGLGFVIFIHELGHFLAAKTFGVRCDKFYVGFDVPISIGPIKLPRTLGKFTYGETEYGIGIIPLGGYVKMLGQDDDPRRQAEENAKVRASISVDGDNAPAEDFAQEQLDPRSYPAKPVWQRMIIISAGVVMNLVSAVFLAAIAYWYGVVYSPTVAGSVTAGAPAWQAGVQPGDRILRFGEMTDDNPNLRYQEFSGGILVRGLDKKADPVDLKIERGGETIDLTVVPTNHLTPKKKFYLVGVGPETAPKLDSDPWDMTSYLSKIQPDLKGGDEILAVDGEELPKDDRYDAVLGHELTSRLQANWESEVTLDVKRKTGKDSQGEDAFEELKVKLPPTPVRTIGIGFKMGPITAIQNNSAAQEAGLAVGDVLKSINGLAVENALKVPSEIGRLAGGGTIALVVDRDGTEVELSVNAPETAAFDPIASYGGALTLNGIGAAFVPSNIVSTVTDQASELGVEVGDELVQFHWNASDETKKELKDRYSDKFFEETKVDEGINIAVLYDVWQSMPEGEELLCFFKRSGKTVKAELPVAYAENWYWHQRGILLTKLKDTHYATGVGEALVLGWGETKKRFFEVLKFLRLLVTGKVGTDGLGGPFEIARAASSEASLGVSRLMLFLTFLSANLAIINFLPIPALDGGHMVFLTAEAIRGKPVNEELQVRLTMMGVLGLLCLMAFVILNDIMRMIS